MATVTSQIQNISAIVAKANAEGRTDLTPDEWAQITGEDDRARDALQAAIDARQ